ncbi:MAG: glycosyltransferase family 4 protein [Planctomycetota bacterium]|nr:glycosyltransferase family 4 protein [Planctomycetota bacterium]
MRFLYLVGGDHVPLGGATLRDAAFVHGLVNSGHKVDALSIFGLAWEEGENGPSPLFASPRPFSSERLATRIEQASASVFDFVRNSVWTDGRKKSSVQRTMRTGRMVVDALSGPKGRRHREFFRLIQALAKRPGKADVAILSNFMLSGLARAIREQVGCPIVCLSQGEENVIESLPEPFRFQARRLVRENARQFGRVAPASENSAILAMETLAIPMSRVRVAPPGVAVGPGTPIRRRRSPFVVGFIVPPHIVGEIDAIVSAVENLAGKRRPMTTELWLAGCPEDLGGKGGILKRLAVSSLGSRLRLFPRLPAEERGKFLAGISVFAVPGPSRDADMPNMLAAMAAGIPVVGSDLGTFREIVSRVPGGVMLPGHAAPWMIAQALEYLADRPDTADELGRIGAEGMTRHFSLEKSAGRLIAIARELFANRGGQAGGEAAPGQ